MVSHLSHFDCLKVTCPHPKIDKIERPERCVGLNAECSEHVSGAR